MQASCDFEQPRGQPYSRPPDFFNRSSRAQAGSGLRAPGVSLEPVRVCAVGLASGPMMAWSGQSESRANPAPESGTTPVATPPVIVAPTGAQVLTGGRGTTENHKVRSLPDWALVNPRSPSTAMIRGEQPLSSRAGSTRASANWSSGPLLRGRQTSLGRRRPLRQNTADVSSIGPAELAGASKANLCGKLSGLACLP